MTPADRIKSAPRAWAVKGEKEFCTPDIYTVRDHAMFRAGRLNGQQNTDKYHVVPVALVEHQPKEMETI
jgi:hypothetical protein